ncbi:response regulator transcription factor [Pseudomonas peli]|uniref:response regulator transcription factor n=1 Tax=Pseudomonas peli TaxID=592361 RepID=UPI0024AE01B1|nr:response regulator transcription factor [Pseudomonas peli]
MQKIDSVRDERHVERILIVDDDPSARIMLNLILSREKHVIVGSAEGGSAALELTDSCAPSIVLLDLDMPWMEGFATLHELRKRYPWLVVLIVSSLEPNIYAGRCARLGARAFLEKGANTKLLADTLRLVRKGLTVFPHHITDPASPLNKLSDFELVAFRCIVRGGGVDNISAALMVPHDRASKLCCRVLAKLKLSSHEEIISLGAYLKIN